MQTPTRRSKRFQPTPSRTRLKSSQGTQLECGWSGAPLHRRPTVREDLADEGVDEWEEGDGETIFYRSFTRKRVVSAHQRSRSSRGRDQNTETFTIGDTVLVKTVARLPSIAVITSMCQVGDPSENNMRINVHWFLRPTELAGIRAKRDHIENEIYYSLASQAFLTPSEIVGSCIVSSNRPESAESKSFLAWSVSPSKTRDDKRGEDESEGEAEEDSAIERFYCHLAVDSHRGLFYEFHWKKHLDSALRHLVPEGTNASWNVSVKRSLNKPSGRSSPRKRRKLGQEDGDTSSDGDSSDLYEESDVAEWGGHSDASEDMQEELHDSHDEILKTPSKRRKRPTPSTPIRRSPSKSQRSPSKPHRSLAAPTPHSKAALRLRSRQAKRTAALPLPAPQFSTMPMAPLPSDPWLRAMHVLHVGARPDALPCREEEYAKVLRCVEELLEEGSGGCIYISGVPGTGKTATVHAIVRELKRLAEQNETNPFTYVEINGLKIPEPAAAYSLLWEGLSGHDVATEGHLKISAKESLKNLSRYFSQTGRKAGPGGHACVVLMDELDQLMTSKQDVVYNFFNWPTLADSKLVVLAVANTMDLPERVMTGRVRSRLGMIRINFQPYTTPQLEKIVHARLQSAKEGTNGVSQDVIGVDGIKFAAMKVSSISGDARRVLDICRRTVELVHPLRRIARTNDVKEVIKVMQNSPTAAFLRDCSFHERLMLAALIKCVKREGVEEIKWVEVQHQHRTYIPALSDNTRIPTSVELGAVLDSLVASRALLFEDTSRKPGGERRVMLNLEQAEVERVLSDVGGMRWRSIFSV